MTATSNFQIFDFKDQSVRVIPGAEPRFVHNDLCRILVLTNPREALRRLDPDDVSQTDIIDAMGRPQKVNVVSEAGMYELILRSDKPAARAFKRWVTHEVLPSLRKTGRYDMNGFGPDCLPPPDPEIPRDNVINFLQNGPDLVRTWPVSKKIYFALCVRRFSKGFGVGWVTMFDAAFGRVQVVPTALLYYVASEIAAADRNLLTSVCYEHAEPDIEELVRRLSVHLSPGEKEQYTFQRIFEVAREGALFGITPTTELDQQTRCVLGKRITAATGKRYGDVVFNAGGSYRRRFYVVRRLNVNGAELTAA